MSSQILVIDDEESIRINFTSFLEDEGHEVLTAAGYTQAMQTLSEQTPDLVIADIILNSHSGMDILREVKTNLSHCPVIIITGQPNIESSSEAVRWEAFDYLTKPVRKATLLKSVRQALYQKNLEEEKERYRRHLEAVFRSMKSAIITVDKTMHVIEANRSAERICALNPKTITGTPLHGLPFSCSRACTRIVQEALEGNTHVQERRIECKHRERPDQIAIINCSPLISHNKRSMGAVLVVRDITRLSKLERELKERYQFQNIIGKSRRMQDIFQLLEDLSDVDTTVLISGESGTGKELIGKAIHYSGTRKDQPFVSVNCAALAENLLESELFGHVKGAFTGAWNDRKGRFQLANGGSILLDEIGETSKNVQLKLLRVLQEKEFEKVGDTRPVSVDVRIISATNSDLREKVAQGTFREDLFYRLKVMEINIPPLRERTEDIPLLVKHFCGLFNTKLGKNIQGVGDEVLDIFLEYSWPGNIRELMHALEHAFILCREAWIRAQHLPVELRQTSLKAPPESGGSDQPETILEVLTKTDWNKAKAARLLGISRQTLYAKIWEFNLSPSDRV